MYGNFGGSFTDQGQQVRNVRLLPLPVGTPSGGTGTFGDPLILQGHTDVSQKPGTAIVLPVAVWAANATTVQVGLGTTLIQSFRRST